MPSPSTAHQPMAGVRHWASVVLAVDSPMGVKTVSHFDSVLSIRTIRGIPIKMASAIYLLEKLL